MCLELGVFRPRSGGQMLEGSRPLVDHLGAIDSMDPLAVLGGIALVYPGCGFAVRRSARLSCFVATKDLTSGQQHNKPATEEKSSATSGWECHECTLGVPVGFSAPRGPVDFWRLPFAGPNATPRLFWTLERLETDIELPRFGSMKPGRILDSSRRVHMVQTSMEGSSRSVIWENRYWNPGISPMSERLQFD